jgi:prophage tail gpP-like protein
MARPTKFIEGLIVRTISIPKSLDEKLNEIAKTEGVSKSELVNSYIISGMDSKEVSDIITKMEDILQKSPEETKKIDYIDKAVEEIINSKKTQINYSYKNSGKQTMIDTFKQTLLSPVKDKIVMYDDSINLDSITNKIKNRIEVILRKIY